MNRITGISLLLIATMLGACHSTPHNAKSMTSTVETGAVATLASTTTSTTTTTTIANAKAITVPPKASSNSTPLSPYSTEGLLALNEFRSNNVYLNDFLIRNRKPDYFFSGDNSDYSYKKIYLVYFESENLYLFDPELPEHYKKFHPLSDSIKESFKKILAEKKIQPTPQSDIRSANDQNDIEKSLTLKNLSPYLNSQLLYAMPRSNGSDAQSLIYPDLYFLDKPLSELLENEYSEKYDGKKQILKLIFPKSYDAGILYKKHDLETRKIFVEHGQNNTSATNRGELSLIVPDFLPGSSFYQTTHGNMTKAFSSLYQVKITESIANNKSLRMRYSIKLCQKDAFDYCAINKNNAIFVRAIVISATLYDGVTKTPIETFVLK